VTCIVCGQPHRGPGSRCSFCAALVYLVSQVKEDGGEVPTLQR
jgi:hypothetical protein